MKKLSILLAAVLIALSAAGCGAVTEPENTSTVPETAAEQFAGLKSPITDYESLEELNALCGAKLARPGVMGVTDESYHMINTDGLSIAEYDFTVNGTKYSMRFVNNSTNDISGVYVNGKTAFEGSEGDATVKAEDCTLARWFTVDGQYVLNVSGKDIDEEWFNGIVEEMKSLTVSGMSENERADAYANLSGEWADTVSKRAHATIKAVDNGVQITVNWADSAFLDNEWVMTAHFSEDGLLSYSDCTYTRIDYTENEDGVSTTVYTDGEGYFSLNSENGTLAWNGAADENCRTCIFAKAE